MCYLSRRRTVGRSPVVEVSNRGLNVFGLIPDHGDGIHGRVTEGLCGVADEAVNGVPRPHALHTCVSMWVPTF